MKVICRDIANAFTSPLAEWHPVIVVVTWLTLVGFPGGFRWRGLWQGLGKVVITQCQAPWAGYVRPGVPANLGGFGATKCLAFVEEVGEVVKHGELVGDVFQGLRKMETTRKRLAVERMYPMRPTSLISSLENVGKA